MLRWARNTARESRPTLEKWEKYDKIQVNRRGPDRTGASAREGETMGINKYYENLIFDSGSKINVSRKVDTHYFDTVHWHPYVEVLVSLTDGNAATINFTRYALGENDIAIVYSGDLHAVHYVTEDSFLIIQFPIALLAVMGELNSVLPQLSRCNCVRHVPGDAASYIGKNYEKVVREFASAGFKEIEAVALEDLDEANGTLSYRIRQDSFYDHLPNSKT